MFERLIKIGLIAVSVATSSLVSGCMNTPEKAIHSQEIVNFSLKLNDLIGEKSNNELETEQERTEFAYPADSTTRAQRAYSSCLERKS